MNELTKAEASAVASYIDLTLFPTIRDNPDIDNVQWLRNLIHGYEKLCAYSGFVGATENREENPMWWKDEED